MAGLWTLKDAHDFDYVRVSLSLALMLFLVRKLKHTVNKVSSLRDESTRKQAVWK
jgi:hypothetical protein